MASWWNRRFASLLVVLVMACVSGRSSLACEGGCGTAPEIHATKAEKTNTGETVLDSPTAIKWKYDRYSTGPPVTVHPERTIWIKISSTDINRIVCTSGAITDVNYSQEKGVKVKISGSQAYLKLQAMVDKSGELQYSTVPVDVYVTCGGDTYGFIGRPLKIPSKTIYLVNPKKKIQEDMDTFRKSNIDQAVKQVLERVFQDAIPGSWLKEKNMQVQSPPGFVIEPIQSWKIPGVGILVRLLQLESLEKASIDERFMLDQGITINPVAISLEKHDLLPGEATRAVILEKFHDR